MRKQRILGKPKKRNPPRNIILFDTETTSEPDENGKVIFDFILGSVIHIKLDNKYNIVKRTEIRLNTPNQFIEILLSKQTPKDRLFVIAHNIGFDIRVLDLPERFKDRGFNSKPPIINNRVFLWTVETDKGKIDFIDTANFGVSTVERLGKDMGIDKLDIDFYNYTLDELYTYCLHDVLILEKFILQYLSFLDTNDLGSFGSTIASQSLITFRSKFLHKKIHIHNKKEAIELERNSYYGGRVEALFIGEKKDEKYYYLDFNSMYPYVMKNYKSPVKFKGYTTEVPIGYMKARMKRSYCIAKVELETDNNIYPLRTKTKLIFPIGRFTTYLHHNELERALNDGHIKRVLECAVYDSEYIFGDYVNFFYSLKEKYTTESNLSWRFMSKLFLNSLYGKWGQIKTHREEVGECDPSITWRMPVYNQAENKHYVEFAWCGKIYRELREGETSFSFPAIAGSVTANARMWLFKHIEIAGKKNTYYMDTDSLIVNQTGYETLKSILSETELGKLKIEHKASNVRIYGAKDYIFGETVKKKGVPSKAEQLTENSWKYLQFQGMINWLNNGAKGSPTGQYRIKRRISKYRKGIVNSNGEVTPIVLHDNYQVEGILADL